MINHALVLLALIAPPAAAGMYKCQGERGAALYQDAPCPAGRELRNFDTDPANVSVVPGIRVQPAERARETGAAKPRTRVASERHAPAKTRTGDPRERKHLSSGMSEAEVVARIGKPDLVTGGRKRRTWVYFPVAGDEATLTTLSLSGGAVTDIERKVMR